MKLINYQLFDNFLNLKKERKNNIKKYDGKVEKIITTVFMLEAKNKQKKWVKM